MEGPPLDGEGIEGGALSEAGTAVSIRAWAEGTCDRSFWSCPGAAGFRLRGPKYFTDKKKIDAGPPVFALMATDLIRTQRKSNGVAAVLPSVKYVRG